MKFLFSFYNLFHYLFNGSHCQNCILFSYLNPQMSIFLHSVPDREGKQLASQSFLLYQSLGSCIISLGFPKCLIMFVSKNKDSNVQPQVYRWKIQLPLSPSALCLLPG